MALRYVSAFAGIGGFEVGADLAGGTECVGLIEWSEPSRKVLSQHYPHIPLMGDINGVAATDLGGDLDALVGGFPCKQTASAAPNQAGLGLDGEDSSRFWEFHRLADEYLRLVDGTRPRWVVIENPDGLRRSRGGRDLATVLRGMADIGYVGAYRVVDGARLGTPQQRKRVLIVGHLGGDTSLARSVLGLTGPSGKPSATDRFGATQPGQPGPRYRLASAPLDPVRHWRKGANPRAALSLGGYETWVEDDTANTLASSDGGLATRQKHLILQAGRLRTYVPTEWERLMGFPDDWTASMARSRRFGSLGDAIHTGTSRWMWEGLVRTHTATHVLTAP
jgi:DNA (cytosine-5)-methyltransferase 1